MSHRLFNSLVVSSSLLLQGGVSGCATTTESASEGTASEGTAPRADTSTSGSESSNDATNADVHTDAAPAAPAAITLASCEAGWHTTKAGPRCEVDTSGVTVCCPTYAMVTPENRASICCVQQGAQPVGSGE
jgi:hypothetical protein